MASNAKDKVTWKGVPLSELSKVEVLTSLKESKDHTLMFKVDGNTLKPFPTEYTDTWDDTHVHLPCSPQNLIPDNGRNTTTSKKRWDLVQHALTQPILNSEDLENTLRYYNPDHEDQMTLTGLHEFFDYHLSGEESKEVFDTVIPAMANLALQLPHLVTRAPPLLCQEKSHSISLTQKQISCLLANAFFCTFERRHGKRNNPDFSIYPDINFNRLFYTRKYKGLSNSQAEKIKCIFHYFKRILQIEGQGKVVTFTRRHVSTEDLPSWDKVDLCLPRLHICSEGLIESEGRQLLQVDFANRRIGGGVLGQGCVQEEILFAICPELIAARIFCAPLNDTECIVMEGAEQFSKYSGYSKAFIWEGDYQDDQVKGQSIQSKTKRVAINAIKYNAPSVQYRQDNINRELNKAYVGFLGDGDSSAVATGNWGCGAYRGDVQLKSLLQLMAAAAAGRDVAYFTFGSEEHRDSIYTMYKYLIDNKITIGELYKVLCEFRCRRQEERSQSLYQYIYDVTGRKKT